ncbi:hypothetical protein B296_00009212 [Ensete ventricosum]|uniref:Uncharacterized protein n=1 Tax=Ensete ventricosum TaxID=4639 RepID=A0A427ANQ4_ENSVE|nr:hypothetical protein B296_00009212 [Ensete ventricosum]
MEKSPCQTSESQIAFEARDVEKLDHSDALVISICIANAQVKRVMVNVGSSADVLYHDTFQKLRLTTVDLSPMRFNLTRITNDSIAPLGMTHLLVLLDLQLWVPRPKARQGDPVPYSLLYPLGGLIGPGLDSHYSTQADLIFELSDLILELINYPGELVDDSPKVMHPIDQPHGEMVELREHDVNNRARIRRQMRGDSQWPDSWRHYQAVPLKEWCRSHSRMGGKGPPDRTIGSRLRPPTPYSGESTWPNELRAGLPEYLWKICYLSCKKELILRMSPDPAKVPHGPRLRYGLVSLSAALLLKRGLKGSHLFRSDHGRGIITRCLLAHQHLGLLGWGSTL